MSGERRSEVAIVGAGVTGLATAAFLLRGGLADVLVLEREERPGGCVSGEQRDGFTWERGPNCGLLASTELVELLDWLGPENAMEPADAACRRRLVLKDGAWRALPSGPLSFLASPLFSPADKLGLFLEPFRPRGADPEETLDRTVLRRLGRSFLDYAIDPFILGIYAGDPARLVTRHAFPKLYRLEQEHGSFLRGALAKAFAGKTPLERRADRSIVSWRGGLSGFPAALARRLGPERLLLGQGEVSVRPAAGGLYALEGAGPRVLARTVVVATAAWELPAAVGPLAPVVAQAMADVPAAPVVQVAAGFRRWRGLPLQAFGGLVPHREGRDVLGALFVSSLFPGRAPAGGALLSLFLGGVRRREIAERPDREIAAIARRALSGLLGCEDEPDLLAIHRYPRAIPQYGPETLARLEALETWRAAHPRVLIGGNAFGGIGLADRVRQAGALAAEVLAGGGIGPASSGSAGPSRRAS